jgi:cytochrome P450
MPLGDLVVRIIYESERDNEFSDNNCFGGGIRSCIGETFAWMEGILVIATIARRWKMRIMPGHPIIL